MSGVTDFIVAGPAGHTRAGPAGSFKAGEAGHSHVGEAATVTISPAGHVPIDTSIARIPYAAPGGAISENKTGGALYTFESGTGGIVNGSGGYVGGGGGGSNTVGGGFGNTGGGGGGSVSSAPAITMPGGGRVDGAAGDVRPAQQGAESHFIPGGQVNVGSSQGGHFTPGGMVPIDGSGSVSPSGGGRGQFSPGGHVQPTPGYSHFTPGGMVPMGMGGSHFVPGGMVPITPNLGIAPNIPPARVNPPRAGHVTPSRLTNWHGPQDKHVQNWPSDTNHHHTTTAGFEPHKTKHVWDPATGFTPFLTMDTVSMDALMQSTRAIPMDDFTGPKVSNTNYDLSQQFNVDRSVHPSQNNSLAVTYQTNIQSSYEPHLDGDTTIDMRDQRPIQNDFSEAVNYQSAVDLSTNVNVANEFKDSHSSLVNYVENKSLTVDDSKSVHNDFSEYMNLESHFDTTVVNNTTVTYEGGSVNFEFNQTRDTGSSSSVERGSGGIVSSKS